MDQSCSSQNSGMAEQEMLQQEYANEKAAEMRCRLNNIPFAFPRVDTFPMSWKLVHSLVYDFLSRLGLQNSLTVFTVESGMKNSMSLLESGWFLKSFIMHPEYHSVLMFLLAQFNAAHDRISEIVEADRCSRRAVDEGVVSRASCQRVLQRLSENVLEQKAQDAARMLEAQQLIEQQRQTEERLREEMQRADAEQRRRLCMAQRARSVEEQRRKTCQELEQQRRRTCERDQRHRSVCEEHRNRIEEFRRTASLEHPTFRKVAADDSRRAQEVHERINCMQEDIAKRAMEQVCHNTRNKILEDIRRAHAEQDRDSDTEREEHRANLLRRRHYDRVAEEEHQAVEAVLANTRQRILAEIRAKEEEMAQEQLAARDLVDDSRVQWRYGAKQKRRPQQPQRNTEEMCRRAGIEYNPQVSRRRSFGARTATAAYGDPRLNQSMRAMNRSQHTGWRMEPLGDLGDFGGEGEEEDEGEDCDVVYGPEINVEQYEEEEEDAEGEGEECADDTYDVEHSQRLRVPIPSRIPRYAQNRSPVAVEREEPVEVPAVRSVPRQPRTRTSHQHHHHHQQTSTTGRRHSVSTVARHQQHGNMSCDCQALAKKRAEERAAALADPNYCHFSRRPEEMRKRKKKNTASASAASSVQNDCIRE